MKILDLSYPKSESKKEIILSSILIGIFTYFFLIIFQPFGTQNFTFSKLLFILFPYAIFTTFSFAIINLYFSERKVNWTVTKEIFKLIFIVFVCAILSYFYNTLIVSKVEISFFNFLFSYANEAMSSCFNNSHNKLHPFSLMPICPETSNA